MKQTIKIIIILFLALGLGLFFGFKNREVEVLVYPPDGGEATSLILNADQLSAGGQTQDWLGWIERTESLPWYVSRAAAITAYFLMFFVIVWGAGMTLGFTYAIANPVEAWVIHKYLSISLGVSVLIHIFSLLSDKFINFKIFDILIPFYSGFKPLYLSLGIIGFYILLAVILSSLLIRLKWPKFWRSLHYSVYALFPMSLIHGFFLGTDSKVLALRAAYFITGLIFFFLLSWRLYRSLKSRS